MPLVRGNSKLGSIWHWALRSGPDCPGRTQLCTKLCYAAHGNFAWPNVKRAHLHNRRMAGRPNFAGWLSRELRENNVRVLRVHSDGDIFDVKYARQLLQVFHLNPQIRFFLYTRSWRIDVIRKVLERMAKLPNVMIWYSIDRETGWPGKRHRRIKLAYLQAVETDIPKKTVNLVFRVQKLRGRVVKKVVARTGKAAMVCPPENGVSQAVRCDKCKFCFRDAVAENRAAPSNDRRVALTVLR